MFNDEGNTTLTSGVKFHSIKVKVKPSGTIPPTGEVPCDIKDAGSSGGRVEGNKIKLDDGEGPFCIQFVLDNDLEWATNGDPIWIQKDACPQDACSVPDQIWVDKTPKNGILTIMNMNVGDRCELHYRLNFTDGRFCDPIIENGGGNTFNS